MAATGTFDLGNYAAALAAVVKAPVDCSPLFRRVAQVLRSEVLACFDQSRTPDGAAWKPLKPQTVRRRRMGGGGAKPLRDTGILMLSATAQGARGHVERVTPTSLTYGSNLDRAGWHAHGTRTIPARNFIGVSAKGMKIIEQMCADFARDKIAGK